MIKALRNCNVFKYFQNNALSELIRHYFVYLFGLGVLGLLSLFVIPFIVRIFGTKVYGEFTLIQNIILISISFISGWLNQSILRFNNKTLYFKNAIYILFILSILPIFLLFASYTVIKGVDVILVLLLFPIVIYGGYFAVKISFFQSENEPLKAVGFDLIRVFSNILVILILFYLIEYKSLYVLFIAMFLSYLIPVVAFQNKFKIKYLSLFKIDYFKNQLSKNINLLNYSLPLALWFVFSSLLNVADRYVISIYCNYQVVGEYSAVYDLINKIVILLFSPFLVAGYPLIAREYNNGNRINVISLLKKIIVYELILFVVSFLFFYYFGFDLLFRILNLKGNEFNRIAYLIFIGTFLWQLAMVAHKPLELMLKTKVMVYIVILSLFVNLVINVVFIKKFGVVVAGYSTVLSAIIYLVVVVVYVYSKNIKSNNRV